MLLFQELKDQMQGPLRVCIGRRSDYHNDGVSAAKNKKNAVYKLGQASNILISGERTMLLFEKARKVGFSGIGLSQKGNLPVDFYISIRYYERLYSDIE